MRIEAEAARNYRLVKLAVCYECEVSMVMVANWWLGCMQCGRLFKVDNDEVTERVPIPRRLIGTTAGFAGVQKPIVLVMENQQVLRWGRDDVPPKAVWVESTWRGA